MLVSTPLVYENWPEDPERFWLCDDPPDPSTETETGGVPSLVSTETETEDLPEKALGEEAAKAMAPARGERGSGEQRSSSRLGNLGPSSRTSSHIKLPSISPPLSPS